MSDKLPDPINECFFIAPIGADGSEERKRSDGVLKYIVSRAARELDLVAVRADQIATPGQINLQVVEHVLTARAAVADLTDLNPNVFYEMAIRHTARLPLVIIAESGCTLPFDIAQMRTIFVDHKDLASADECRTSIVSQLRSALDDGVVDSPIATSIDLSSMSGGTAVERSVAEVVTSVEQIALTQKLMMGSLETIKDHQPPSRNRIASGAIREMQLSLEILKKKLMKSEDPELFDVVQMLERVVRHVVKTTQVERSTYQFSSRWSEDMENHGILSKEELRLLKIDEAKD